MAWVSSYKSLIIPVQKARAGTLLPSDIIELNIHDFKQSKSQDTKTYVTSTGFTHVLVGERGVDMIDTLRAVHVHMRDVRRLEALIGRAIAIRDAQFYTIGGVLQKITPARDIKFQTTIKKVDIKIAVDSMFPSIVPSAELRQRGPSIRRVA